MYPVIVYFEYQKPGLLTFLEYSKMIMTDPGMLTEWTELCEFYTSIRKNSPTYTDYRKNREASLEHDYGQYRASHLINTYTEIPNKQSLLEFLEEAKQNDWRILMDADSLNELLYTAEELYNMRSKTIVASSLTEVQNVMSSDIENILKRK